MNKADAFDYFQLQLVVFKRGILPSVIIRIIRRIMLSKISIKSPCLKHIRDSGYVYAVTLSPDEEFLASAGENRAVKIYQVGGDFPLLKSLTHHYTDQVCALAFSKNASLLASGGNNRRVIVVDLAHKFNIVANLKSHASGVFAVCFAPNSLWLMSVHQDGTIVKYDVNTNFAVLEKVKPHSTWVTSLSFNADCNMLASGSYDGTINVYTVSDFKTVKTFTGYKSPRGGVSFSGDGQWFASVGDDHDVMIFDLQKDFALVKKTDDNTGCVFSLCFTSDSRHLLTGSADGSIKVYDCSDNFSLIQSIAVDTHKRNGVLFVRVSRNYLISSGFTDDGTVKVWELEYK
jgi:WD40 repeat protein